MDSWEILQINTYTDVMCETFIWSVVGKVVFLIKWKNVFLFRAGFFIWVICTSFNVCTCCSSVPCTLCPNVNVLVANVQVNSRAGLKYFYSLKLITFANKSFLMLNFRFIKAVFENTMYSWLLQVELLKPKQRQLTIHWSFFVGLCIDSWLNWIWFRFTSLWLDSTADLYNLILNH